MSSAGIDYSHGRANFDPSTGIHYGIISPKDVGFVERWYDSSTSVYSDPECPRCLEKGVSVQLTAMNTINSDQSEGFLPEGDWFCRECMSGFDDCVVDYPDEPLGFKYEDGEYSLWQSANDSDIWVFKSPYVTLAAYCSPCAPGAGDLSAAIAKDEDWEAKEREGYARTYALGPDWFESEETPYAVIDA